MRLSVSRVRARIRSRIAGASGMNVVHIVVIVLRIAVVRVSVAVGARSGRKSRAIRVRSASATCGRATGSSRVERCTRSVQHGLRRASRVVVVVRDGSIVISSRALRGSRSACDVVRRR